MKSLFAKLIFAFMVAGLLSACATFQPVPPFSPVDIDAGGHALKKQNAVFILDASASMEEGSPQYKKFDQAKALLENMAKTMPANMPVQTEVRSFGHDPKFSSAITELLDDMGAFNRKDMTTALAGISKAGGTSPMETAIDAAGEDLDGASGNTAMIIVSDGKNMGSAPVAAAAALKEKMGDSLCIYTVLVGDDAAGQKLMDAVAEAGGCGFATTGDALMDGAAMAGFITKVFIGDAIDSDGDGVGDMMDKCPGTPAGVKVDAAGCPLDSDKDGVPDYLDKCPGTPAGTKVDSTGCPITVLDSSKDEWSFHDILFDVNKAVIKPVSFGTLDAIVQALQQRPRLTVRIEGHTDITGSHAYNMDLSKRRAKAVVDYLVNKGIASSRLTSEGYGPDRPIADNNTKEGRALNRRVNLVKTN
ncbi:OmpA family protein [Desulfosarcina ovata]|uniref:Cell envelope biogenesis protein OmpA n=1 Tax=Desulfosarcina ovata subsp. ovata TaxID=2752305 RepID=A0A5K8A6N6_9BACT|nr:OmpA family protein [Desulfosarcina ovata]BBO87820.1 hypothetical protein DSCOOX_10000 [Desulfosarcina ovata subsp. ovata]